MSRSDSWWDEPHPRLDALATGLAWGLGPALAGIVGIVDAAISTLFLIQAWIVAEFLR